jgi:hypothetical protein
MQWFIQREISRSIAVMGADEEAFMAEFVHHLHEVGRHCSLGIKHVLRIVGSRLRRCTVSAQIGGNHGEPLCQLRRDAMPDQVRLGMTMQQQQRRPVTTQCGKISMSQRPIAVSATCPLTWRNPAIDSVARVMVPSGAIS